MTLYADALLAASIINRSSMRFSAGGGVDCTMKTVHPRILSSNAGWNSPSLNLLTDRSPSSHPYSRQSSRPVHAMLPAKDFSL